MTLCIAASCTEVGKDLSQRNHYIVLCADRKIGTWAARAETGMKLRWARANWPALISGDMARATDLLATISSYLSTVSLNSKNIFDAMKSAGIIFREKLANDLVQRNLSVSYEYLKKNRSKFPREKVLETYTKISQIDSEAEVIIAGFIDSRSYIFIVERDCSVSHHDNFACIGTGAYIADPALYQRQQNSVTSLARTFYHVYEAKRLGEIADGVGKSTMIMAVAPPIPPETEIRHLPLNKLGIIFLEKKYLEYSLKPTFDLQWPKESVPLSATEWEKSLNKEFARSKKKIARLGIKVKRLQKDLIDSDEWN